MNKVNPNFNKQLLSLTKLLIDLSKQNELLVEFLKIEEKNTNSYYFANDVLMKKFINKFTFYEYCLCGNKDC